MDDLSTVIDFQTIYETNEFRIAQDTGYFQGNEGAYFYVYNLDNGNLIWQLTGHYSSDYDLIRNRLFSTNGLYMDQ
jgi:outer membrane protein assembly factor BamB